MPNHTQSGSSCDKQYYRMQQCRAYTSIKDRTKLLYATIVSATVPEPAVPQLEEFNGPIGRSLYVTAVKVLQGFEASSCHSV